MGEHTYKRLISSGKERTRQLLLLEERKFQAAFVNYVRAAKSNVVFDRVTQLLVDGNLSGAVDLINAQSLDLANTVVDGVVDAARQGVSELAGISMVVNPGSHVVFDPTTPRLMNLMNDVRQQFITQFTTTQLSALTAAEFQSSRMDISTNQVVANFKQAIGLTQVQVDAVTNYRRLLEQGSAEALDRDLRDRRFDRTVRRAKDVPLTKDQIDRMVAAYARRSLSYRGESLSRRIAGMVVSQGSHEALLQTIEQGGVDAGNVDRVWNTFDDGKVRDQHFPMDGQIAGVDEPFIDGDGNRLMYPHDPAAPAKTTSGCRCFVTHRIRT